MNDKIYNVSTKWFSQAPFLAEFMLRFEYIVDNKMPTVGICKSDKSNIAISYNEEFVNSLSDSEMEAVLLHEVMHLLMMTKERKGCRDHKLFNIASDMIINDEIENSFRIGNTTLNLPEFVCRLSSIPEYTGSKITEEVYDYLEKECSSKIKDNLKTVDVHDFLDSLTEKERVEFERQIEKIKQVAKTRSWGSISQAMQESLTQLLKPKKISFRQILRREIQNYTFGKDVKINSFAKTNRRGFQTLPGKKKVGKKLNIVIDTSGSCFSKETQSVFFSEIDYISSKVSDIKIIEFDTEIHQEYKYRKGAWKKIKFEGGGGTEIQPVFDKLKGNKNSTIIFTDGYLDKNVNTYGLKPLWVIVDGDKFEVTRDFLNE